MKRLTCLLALALLLVTGPAWAGDQNIQLRQSGGTNTLLGGVGDAAKVTIVSGSSGAAEGGCMATVNAPTYVEGTDNPQSCDLAGNTRTIDTIHAGEDTVNNLVQTSGGKVRGTVGNVASSLLVGADCTSHCTPATYVALPKGSKTFTSTLVSSTSAATTVAQVHKIYGGNTNTFTDDDAVLLCTVTFTSATQYLLKAFTQACAPVNGDWLYYGVISSGTTGTATVTGAVTATY